MPAAPAAAPARRALICDPWTALVLTAIALVGACLFARIGNPTLYGSDFYSDADMLTSGRHFGRDGFVRLHFLPVLSAGPLSEPPCYYTHYPPLANWICGVLYRLGARSLATYRLLPTVASLVALWMAYLCLRLFMSSAAASWATLLMATSAPFLPWAQSLHQHAYNLAAMTAFLYLLLSPPLAGKPRRPALLWILLFVQSLVTFEYYLYCLIMMGALAALPERVWTRRQLAAIASALFIGFGLHVAQNIWALGWQPAMHDLVSAAAKRTVGAHASMSPVSLGTWGSSILAFLAAHYLPVWCAFVTTGALLPRRAWLPMLRGAGLLWWMLGLASVSYWLVMRQHSACHVHDVRHAMLFLFGSAGRLLDTLHSYRRDRAAPFIAAIVLLLGLSQGVRTFINDTQVGASLPGAERGVSTAVAYLRDALPQDHEIWTNCLGTAVLLMYHLDRSVIHVDGPDSDIFRVNGVDTGRPTLPLASDGVQPLPRPVAFILDPRVRPGKALSRLLEHRRGRVIPGAGHWRILYLPADAAAPARGAAPAGRGGDGGTQDPAHG